MQMQPLLAQQLYAHFYADNVSEQTYVCSAVQTFLFCCFPALQSACCSMSAAPKNATGAMRCTFLVTGMMSLRTCCYVAAQ
jgi:hypothetical protein